MTGPAGDKTLRSYQDAVAMVTGGASGIGRALATALAGRGARVVLADLDEESAGKVAAGLRSQGGEASAVGLDVADFPAVERLVQDTVRAYGRLDYLFNNAGIVVGGELRLYRIDDWHRVFDVNLRGVANGVQAAYAVMLEQGFGHIVNTASLAGLTPITLAASYCATKHGIVGLSMALRMEAAAMGIRVSVLCPGVVRTPMLVDGGRYGKLLHAIPPAAQEQTWERLRPMEPDDFARRALRAVARNKAVIILPARWRPAWWLYRLSPTLWLALGRRVYRAMKRALDAETSGEA